MGEIVRKLENDRRSKDCIRINAKARFLTKEFSQPIMAFNEMVVRLKKYTIEKASREYKLFRFQQDREIDDITNFKKSLLYKSLNFDAEEFHGSFDKYNRARTPSAPDMSNIRRALRSLPANTALDFPTAVRPPSRNVLRIHSGRSSVMRKKTRPATSLPNSSRIETTASIHSRPTTPHIRSKSCVGFVQSSPGHEFSSRPESARSIVFPDENFDEQNGRNLSISTSKSYRCLKDKFTNKETDIPRIDPKAHKLKHLKQFESLNAKVIDKKVKIFLGGNFPGEKCKAEDMIQL